MTSLVKGVTFSHLATNRSLTPGRLVLLLSLRQLHSSQGDPATFGPSPMRRSAPTFAGCAALQALDRCT